MLASLLYFPSAYRPSLPLRLSPARSPRALEFHSHKYLKFVARLLIARLINPLPRIRDRGTDNNRVKLIPRSSTREPLLGSPKGNPPVSIYLDMQVSKYLKIYIYICAYFVLFFLFHRENKRRIICLYIYIYIIIQSHENSDLHGYKRLDDLLPRNGVRATCY